MSAKKKKNKKAQIGEATKTKVKVKGESKVKSNAKLKSKKPATAESKAKTKATAKRKAASTIKVGITPPWLAPESMAAEVYELFGNKATRPPSAELSAFPWLRQDEAYQIGYYLMTHGLREHSDHPEIEICNVPGVFVGAATDLLNSIADYVLAGSRLADGETMQMQSDLLKVLAFREIKPGEDGTDHESPVLRVLFLC